MDWQLIIDPGMVLQYMSKYVTKSDNSQSKHSLRLIRNLFDKTVTNEGRSSQAFLRCVMSKYMKERVMSKQETCHLILGLPIVHCTHRLLNINLENITRKIILPSAPPRRIPMAIIMIMKMTITMPSKMKMKNKKKILCYS